MYSLWHVELITISHKILIVDHCIYLLVIDHYFYITCTYCQWRTQDLFQGGGGGVNIAYMPWDSNTFFFSFLKIFGSIFQTQSWGTHRTSPPSLTSKKKIQGGGGGGIEPPCTRLYIVLLNLFHRFPYESICKLSATEYVALYFYRRYMRFTWIHCYNFCSFILLKCINHIKWKHFNDITLNRSITKP